MSNRDKWCRVTYWLSPVSCLMCAFISGVTAQFPMECQSNLTEQTGVCCPIPAGFIDPCGGAGRGHCVRLPQVSVEYYPEPPEDDERLNWPHRYVQMGCRCEANFYGADCSSCKFGYTGTSCDQKLTLVRRNIADYSPQEKRVFRDTVERSKFVNSGYGIVYPPAGSQNNTETRLIELSIWDLFQYYHYRSAHRTIGDCGSGKPTPVKGVNFAHSGPHFPVWHRRYMLWMERELRQISDDPDFTLPYWDWIDAKHCDVCTNDLVGKRTDNGNTLDAASPFSSWQTSCVKTESGGVCGMCDPTEPQGPLERTLPGGYPSRGIVEFTLSRPKYDSESSAQLQIDPGAFRLLFEIVHGLGHVAIGGHMQSLLTAANDPIFLFHHTMVDKLLEVWFSNHGIDPTEYPSSHGLVGSLAEDPMVPFFPPEYNIDYYKLSSEFGYEYDTLCLSYQDPGNCALATGPALQAADEHDTSSKQNEVDDVMSDDGVKAMSACSEAGIGINAADTDLPQNAGEVSNVWKTLAIGLLGLVVILVVLMIIAMAFLKKKGQIHQQKDRGHGCSQRGYYQRTEGQIHSPSRCEDQNSTHQCQAEGREDEPLLAKAYRNN